MNEAEVKLMQEASEMRIEREMRRKKHLVICKIADEVYQDFVKQNLSCEDVETLCKQLIVKAKRSPIC